MVTKTFILCIFALLSLSNTQLQEERAWDPEEETPEYWIKESEMELEKALKHEKLNMNVARNVILFLGDGMGISTVTAGRVMKGQLEGKSGEETVLKWDEFPHSGLSKTYSVNKDVSDSATTSIAYLCGVKSTYGTLGVSGKVTREDCSSVKGNEVNSILIDSFEKGKSTGIVTTAHITHATPAGAYAHTAERHWYSDADLTEEAVENGCKDVAQQFIDYSDKITVAMGGGRKYFYREGEQDPEYLDKDGNRKDGQNLAMVWQQKFKDLNAEYVWNKTAFDAVDHEKTDKLLGLFERSHMQYEDDRAEDGAGEPSLAEMTDKAIRILQKNTKGYFLLVEGAKIDRAHHDNNAHRALTEVVSFDDAIRRGVELTSESDTLIVVTADHSHTLTMGGYSDRGNSILGLAPSNEHPELADDDKPYTTLLYGTGPGYQGNLNATSREEINQTVAGELNYLQQSAVPIDSATHAGEDVSIKARGPMAHLFHGVHEQTYIPYVMRYVSCVGENQDHCKGISQIMEEENDEEIAAVFLGKNLDHEHASIALYAQFYILLTIVFLISLTCVKKSSFKYRSSNSSERSSYVKEDAYVTTIS